MPKRVNVLHVSAMIDNMLPDSATKKLTKTNSYVLVKINIVLHDKNLYTHKFISQYIEKSSQ